MKRFLGITKSLILSTLATVLVLSVAAGFTVWRESTMRNLERVDAIVVLGAAQYAGKPSPVLKNRLDTAAQVQESGYADIIVTVGSNLPGDTTTEAEAGREYLIRKYDANPDNVIAIAEGKDTYSSIHAVHKVAQEKAWSSFIFVSDSLHSARIKTIAESFGYEAFTTSAEAGPGSSFEISYFAKESAGVVYFWVSRLRGTL